MTKKSTTATTHGTSELAAIGNTDIRVEDFAATAGLAEIIAKESDIEICNTELKDIKKETDLQNELAGAMLANYTGGLRGHWGKPRGSNNQPKKKIKKDTYK